MASGFGAASLPLLSAIALLVGAILLILGFAAPYWAFDGTHYRGLWRYGRCANEGHRDCYHYDEPSIGYIEDWLHAVRALECVSIVFVSIPLVVLPVYMYVALGMYYKRTMGFMCISSLLSALSGIIGVIIYGVNLTDKGWDVSWSLICVIIGCACIFIGFLVLLISMIAKRPQSITEPYYPTTIFVDPQKNRLYTIPIDDDD